MPARVDGYAWKQEVFPDRCRVTGGNAGLRLICRGIVIAVIVSTVSYYRTGVIAGGNLAATGDAACSPACWSARDPKAQPLDEEKMTPAPHVPSAKWAMECSG